MLSVISLSITTILLLYLSYVIYKKEHMTQMRNVFLCTLACLFIWCVGLIAQLLFSKRFNINPIYFDYFVYIGNCFLPVTTLFIGLIFSRTKITFKRIYFLLFVIPILSLILLWTNDYHHLFYTHYSTDMNETVFGPYFTIHSIYTYLLLFIGIYLLIKHSIKHSGIFSRQVFLITIGALLPIVINILGSFNIIKISIYTTPITFAITILLFAISIFKFGFLNITPIAFQKIADRMSNGYIVLNEFENVVDCNKTLLDTFSLDKNTLMNKPLISILKKYNMDTEIVENAFEKVKHSNETISIEHYFKAAKKYFTVEFTSIRNKNSFIGTLILFNDITQHKLDLQTIKNNQDILVERERLATLGQMIGGIAHNLKTPIMSISGAAEGILDLIHEYSVSIGDPEVTKEDHLEIAGEMEEWIHKIQSHLSYMSDVITTVKGQAVAFSDTTTFTSFTVEDFIRQVNILMKHELSNALVELEEKIEISNDTVVKGNINSLVQVVNNIISNAIQAYNGKEGEKIILDVYKDSNTIVVKIQDFAGGISDSVKHKLFKEMITTKGKNGTGLGLFMSYSNIKAHFNGNIRFETRKGKGTSFYIELPC